MDCPAQIKVKPAYLGGGRQKLLCGAQGSNGIKHSFVDEKCLHYDTKKSGKWKKPQMNSF